MYGALDEITGEVELEGRGLTISCNGWELELSSAEAKQLVDFLNVELEQDSEDDDQ